MNPGGFLDRAQVIAWFTNAYKQVTEEVRAGIKDAEKPDPTTSNLLQTVENAIGKYRWQMRAFVQATPTDPNSGLDINRRQAGRPGQPGPVRRAERETSGSPRL